MKKKLAIIGVGGHGKVVGEIALLSQYETIDFFDDKINEIKKFPFIIRGNIDQLKSNLKEYDVFFVAIGDNHSRYNKISWLKKEKVSIASLVHPKSVISKFSSIGAGSCVMTNAAVNPGTFVKEGVIINTSSSIDHDCVIDQNVHIAPGAILCGNVRVGKGSFIGAGAKILPGVIIPENSIVKSGTLLK